MFVSKHDAEPVLGPARHSARIDAEQKPYADKSRIKPSGSA